MCIRDSLDALAAVLQHGMQLRFGKGGFFAAALDLHELAVFREDEVAVHIGGGVFLVTEVEPISYTQLGRWQAARPPSTGRR